MTKTTLEQPHAVGAELCRTRDVTRQRYEDIAKARRAGERPGDIARRHGVSEVTVYKALRKAGIQPAHPERAERARAHMRQMANDPASPLRIGRVRDRLELARKQGDVEQVRSIIKGTATEVLALVLEDIQKFKNPSRQSDRHPHRDSAPGLQSHCPA